MSAAIISSNARSQDVSYLPFRNASVVNCPVGTVCSTNWSGYAALGSPGSVGDAAGSWIVPAVTCPKHGSTYAALWVGIDGYNSGTVEQTGILAQCSAGKATYSAWYEFYPASSVTIPGFSVAPGQIISSDVSFSSGKFTSTISNHATGKTFSKTSAVAGAQRSSAEWIMERPLLCNPITCNITHLSNFGKANFGFDHTSIANTNDATISSVSGPISSFRNVAITMVSSTGATLALPSTPLSTDGTSFVMTYR
jgi:hypothetical protein